MIFQILLAAFALFAIVKTWGQYRRSQVSKYWMFMFTLLWVVVIVVTAIPHLADMIAGYVGIGRGADLILYCAVVALTYAVYRSIVREQKLSAEMTALVRAVAVEQARLPEGEVKS
jgi:hypothetical protein